MSHTKGGGSTRNINDSPGQRLGVKIFGGQVVKSGAVIVRQRGVAKTSGPGTRIGKDHTIFAVKDGKVGFKQIRKTRFSGHRLRRTQVQVS